MPFSTRKAGRCLILELEGAITIRQAQQLWSELDTALDGSETAEIRTEKLEDADTSILQILCSLRKTVRELTLPDPSQAFLAAVDRCGLRRTLGGSVREGAG
jgi:ABC-type transporter Mla MlaB component